MKLRAIFTAAILALTLFASPAGAASDLPKSHGFYEEMTYLINKGVISGFEDGTVKPDKTVSRAEAAIMIGKMKGFKGTASATKFKDVSKSQKASGYIAAAEKAGYISGYPNGTFKPNAPITRGDMAIILSRVFPIPYSTNISFKDVSPNMSAYDAIGKMVFASITTGYTDNTFKPNNSITRSQFSAFLARGLEPAFKNDVNIANSFMKDKTKQFVYESENGSISTHLYTNKEKFNGMDFGFLWAVKTKSAATQFYYEMESREMLIMGYPESEADIELVYPIAKGKRFNLDSYYTAEHQITGVNVKVETKYKTFTNAVEVTIAKDTEFRSPGYKYYMVEGFGNVKTTSLTGKVLNQLIDIK